MAGGCPFSSIGLNLIAALAGVSALFLNSQRIVRKALGDWQSLPRGVERDREGKLWFREVSDFWKGQAFCIEISKVWIYLFGLFVNIVDYLFRSHWDARHPHL
jgi:hypothetical protein